MATTNQAMTETAMRLRLTQKAKDKLTEQAAESGRPLDEIASELLEQAVTRPTIAELLAPVRADFAGSGMSDEEVMKLGRRELDALRQERKANPA